jgi:hypothetical protein
MRALTGSGARALRSSIPHVSHETARMKASTHDTFPPVAGGLDAYEFYIWFQLYFLCHDCGESLDCPVADDDIEAPEGKWMRRNAQRARSLGWYVHPLSADGSLTPICFCPGCAASRYLVVPQ